MSPAAITLVESENPAEPLKGKVIETCSTLDGFVVTCSRTYTRALEACSVAKALVNEIKSKFAPRKAAAHAAHKALTDWENEEIAPLLSRIEVLNRAALGWKRTEDDKARAEAAEAQARAKREAEDRIIAQAAKLETLGETAKAEAVLARPVLVPVVLPAETAVPKIDGASFRQGFEVEIVDIDLFLRFVGSDPDAHGYLVTPNLSALKSLAKAQKSSFNIPGCVLRTTETLVQRRSS